MLARARQAVTEVRVETVEFLQADAQNLPVDDASVDVAFVNGIFNLNPARDAIFRELARVMRQNGAVYAAELVLQGPLPPQLRESETDWFA
jgi:ubiquinone/menaquinone biosynthesis C-methylase UbiE